MNNRELLEFCIRVACEEKIIADIDSLRFNPSFNSVLESCIRQTGWEAHTVIRAIGSYCNDASDARKFMCSLCILGLVAVNHKDEIKKTGHKSFDFAIIDAMRIIKAGKHVENVKLQEKYK